MSHLASIDIRIDSLPALKNACAELGLTFVENQRTHEWFGQFMDDYHGTDAAYRNGIDPKTYGTCLHAIRVPGCKYEIGVVNHPSGQGLTLVYDFWGPGQRIVEAVGKGCEKLKQFYGLHRGILEAKAKGWITQRKTCANGSIKLQILNV